MIATLVMIIWCLPGFLVALASFPEGVRQQKRWGRSPAKCWRRLPGTILLFWPCFALDILTCVVAFWSVALSYYLRFFTKRYWGDVRECLWPSGDVADMDDEDFDWVPIERNSKRA